MVMGACVTPTDPVLANSILKGKFADEHIPLHVRLLLSGERQVKTQITNPIPRDIINRVVQQ